MRLEKKIILIVYIFNLKNKRLKKKRKKFKKKINIIKKN